MQIVIDIDINLYARFFNNGEDNYDDVADMAKAIRKGKLLPKGHGRLIDADALEGHRQIQIISNGNGKYVEVMTYYQNDIDIAPTIIEADKAESEDKE